MSDRAEIFPVSPMIAFYAAVEAVADGKAGEIDMDFRVDAPDGLALTVSIVVRKEPKPFVVTTLGGSDAN